MQRAKILFVGNPIAADDSIGPVLHAMLRHQLPPSVGCECVSAIGLDLLELIFGENRLIIVDATCSGVVPGTVTVSRGDIAGVRASNVVTAHRIEISDILAIAREIIPERVPNEVFVVGIEGHVFHWLQRGLSPEVRDAIPTVVARLSELINCPLFAGAID